MPEDSAMCSKQKEKKGAEEREQQHVQNKSKKRKEICPYGNYKHYYGYRVINPLPATFFLFEYSYCSTWFSRKLWLVNN